MKIASVKLRKKQSRSTGDPPETSIMTQKYYFTGTNELASKRKKKPHTQVLALY